MFGAPLREMTGGIPAAPQFPAYGLRVVRLVAQDRLGVPSRSAEPASDGRDAIDQIKGLGDVVNVHRSGDDFERGAASIADQVVFAARLPSVDRCRRTLFRADVGTIHAGPGPIEFADRVQLCEQNLMQPVEDPRLLPPVQTAASTSDPSRTPTPAVVVATPCRCRGRNRMSCRQSRSGTGLGPGDRSGQGGRSGSISAHKSSSTIHGRLLTPSRTTESSHRARTTSTFRQDHVTSAKRNQRLVERDQYSRIKANFCSSAASYRLLVKVPGTVSDLPLTRTTRTSHHSKLRDW